MQSYKENSSFNESNRGMDNCTSDQVGFTPIGTTGIGVQMRAEYATSLNSELRLSKYFYGLFFIFSTRIIKLVFTVFITVKL